MQLMHKHFTSAAVFSVLAAGIFFAKDAAENMPREPVKRMMVYTLAAPLREAAVHPIQTPAGVPPENKKFSINYGLVEKAGESVVRMKQLKLGADYQMTDRQSVGVETSQEFKDSQDAQAWDKAPKGEQAANVKYKLSF